MKKMTYKFNPVISALGFALGWCFSAAYLNPSEIPNNTEVQAHYVAPSNLEVEMEDLDRNGELETILVIDEQPFRLMYESNGQPQLLDYQLPVEVMPTQYNSN